MKIKSKTIKYEREELKKTLEELKELTGIALRFVEFAEKKGDSTIKAHGKKGKKSILKIQELLDKF